jgi:hypothetical protein
MKLREARVKFTSLLPLLIAKAIELGYEIAIGPDHEKHKKNSLHFDGLAKDFDLYKNGVWLTKTEDHQALGEYWESIGGAWGGRWGDGNHYSLAYGGRK